MKKLFVIGLQKTGTSSMVGLLNSHPNIFVMYEVNLKGNIISKYGSQIINALPEVRKCFDYFAPIGELYSQFHKIINNSNFSDNIFFFGDKLLKYDFLEANNYDDFHTIFMIRDIKTWLSKEQIQKIYFTNIDIVIPSIMYLKYFINSFKVKSSIRIKMEDLVLDQGKVINKLINFLELDQNLFKKEWWNEIGNYENNSIKNYIQWYKGHISSHNKPENLDTESEFKNNSFWEEYLPLFNKYYQNLDRNFSDQDIQNDLNLLKKISSKYSLIPLKDALNFKTHTIKKLPLKKRIKNSLIRRFTNLINFF